jgi:aminoglycoside phosphotransferase (APT) family kinase protein
VSGFEHGPLLASGRDADIFEYGTTQVLRRSRKGRSMELEARAMRYAHEQGYPTPRVDELSDDGTDLVMERIAGVNMVDALNAAPCKAKRLGRMLADLHTQLHELSSPEWMAPAPLGFGDRLVHLDLHPLNVMMSPRGPIVIDWARAARGDPNTDVALTWTLISAGEVPTRGVKGKLVGLIRARLIHGFMGAFDRVAIGSEVDAVVQWKVRDPNMSESEIASMHAFARRVQERTGQ